MVVDFWSWVACSTCIVKVKNSLSSYLYVYVEKLILVRYFQFGDLKHNLFWLSKGSIEFCYLGTSWTGLWINLVLTWVVFLRLWGWAQALAVDGHEGRHFYPMKAIIGPQQSSGTDTCVRNICSTAIWQFIFCVFGTRRKDPSLFCVWLSSLPRVPMQVTWTVASFTFLKFSLHS